VRTLTKIIGGSTDSSFICQWDGRDAYENLRASTELENACMQCGGSAIQLEGKLGKAIVTGGEVQVSCVCDNLRKQGWKQDAEQEAAHVRT
jgi:hypothetical protein